MSGAPADAADVAQIIREALEATGAAYLTGGASTDVQGRTTQGLDMHWRAGRVQVEIRVLELSAGSLQS